MDKPSIPCTEAQVRHERELRVAWETAHEAAHLREHEAMVIARTEINRRLDEMNLLREQVNRERGDFVRRDMYDREHATLRDSLDSRLKELERNKASSEGNSAGRMWTIGIAITLLSILANVIVAYVRQH